MKRGIIDRKINSEKTLCRKFIIGVDLVINKSLKNKEKNNRYVQLKEQF